MKKLPILFLSILIASIVPGTTPKASAIYVDRENIAWWTVEEILEFSEIAKAEREDICGSDISCYWGFYFSKLESENYDYIALDMLEQERFWITSVNPKDETLEVLYFDRDLEMDKWGRGKTQPLDYIFMAWFNQVNGQVSNYNRNLPIEPQFSDDLHLLYANDSSYHDGGVFPTNTPFSLSINKTNLIDNTLGHLYFAVYGDFFNAKGYFDYSPCLESEDYEDGATCYLTLSPEKGIYRYQTLREIDSSNNERNDEDIATREDETDEIFEPQDETNTGTTDEVEKNNIVAEEPKKEQQTDDKDTIGDTSQRLIGMGGTLKNDSLLASSSIKAPDTGKHTELCKKTIEFPWWLVILIALGDAVVLWLFWPKSRKNPKKPLDKNIRVR